MRGDIPSHKKISFKISEGFKAYLNKFNRTEELPIQYEDLTRYTSSIPLLDSCGNDTLWETVFYPQHEMDEISKGLTQIYALLKTDGNNEVLKHLSVARIDFCGFGNTQPFRIRIINRLNDNYDHFYVKKEDASRVYGLELEHLLSPNYVSYIVDKKTLIEVHIPGIPGDVFIKNNLEDTELNQTRIAKEFVKFNERCFVQLLGDMRSYNYVVNITPDIEGSQFRFRAIDFDQQSYEGRKSFYLPQYFKENNPIVNLGIKQMSHRTVRQYQMEERTLIAVRLKTEESRVRELMEIMVRDQLSFPKKIEQLKKELAHHHKNSIFDKCKTMGEVVLANIQLLLTKDFKQST